MNRFRLYALIVVLGSTFLGARTVLKNISIDYIEEMVDDRLFTYRCDAVDGVLKEMWTVEGKKVDKIEYDSQVLQAEMAERSRIRAQEYEMRLERMEFKKAASRGIYRKLLLDVVGQLEALLEKFNQYNLLPHVVEGKNTFRSLDEFQSLQAELVPHLRTIVVDREADLSKMQKSYEDAHGLPEKLQRCLYETIQHVIGTVDDTRQLKELLNLISQEP